MPKAKSSTVFFCSSCGYESSKWMGQCPGCREWNTFAEEKVVTRPGQSSKAASSARGGRTDNVPKLLSEIDTGFEERIHTNIKELDRVLGGGLVPGSLVLVGGDPGIGKSTLLLQVCKELSESEHDVLYVSGEESLRQIKMRAQRIGKNFEKLSIYAETNLTDIENTIRNKKPEVVVIDSIQTMFSEDISSAPGSVSQVRETTAVLLSLAKGLNITIFIVGHVTKEGTVAGPRVLEHMVDTVLYFEGDRFASYRVLRGVKNRFGSTNEIGVFEMRSQGLVEVSNPSEYMLSGRPKDAKGSVVICAMEGTRPILLEIQALVCQTSFGIPRRQATGTDYNRVNLLMAVLEKKMGLHLSDCDAYVNVAGGMKITEPGADLGIVMAIVSSFKNSPIDEGTLVFGEIGLSGEVRSVSNAEQRITEAQKLGFKRVILPKSSLKSVRDISKDIELIGVDMVDEALRLI